MTSKEQIVNRTEPPYWEQPLPGESDIWFQRFRSYLLMPQPRYMVACVNLEREKRKAKKTRSAPGSWQVSAVKFEWKKRARAYDDWVFRKEEEEYRNWKKDFIGQLRADHRDMIELAKKMLEVPLVTEKQTEDGKTIAVPARWTFRDAIAAKATARDLGLTIVDLVEPNVDLIQATKRYVEEGILAPEALDSAQAGYRIFLDYLRNQHAEQEPQVFTVSEEEFEDDEDDNPGVLN